MRDRRPWTVAWQLYASPLALWQALCKMGAIARTAGLGGLRDAVRRKVRSPTIAIGHLMAPLDPSQRSDLLRSPYTASRLSATLSVTAVIATKGRQDLIATCLEGIARTVYSEAQLRLTIINNGNDIVMPPDFPFPITVRRESRPFNWSAYNNDAARAAASTFLLFLNDDIEPIHCGWLDAMLEASTLPAVGSIGALLLYPTGRIQHFGIGLSGTGLPYHEDRGGWADAVLDRPGTRQQETFAVTGACMLTRRDVFWRVHGFDPRFALNYNDVDFCRRLRALGLRTVVTADARLTHHETSTRSLATGRREQAQFLRALGKSPDSGWPPPP